MAMLVYWRGRPIKNVEKSSKWAWFWNLHSYGVTPQKSGRQNWTDQNSDIDSKSERCCGKGRMNFDKTGGVHDLEWSTMEFSGS